MQEGRKRVARITVKLNDAKRVGGILSCGKYSWRFSIATKGNYSLSGRYKYILWNTGIMTDVSVSHRLADWFLGLTNLGDMF